MKLINQMSYRGSQFWRPQATIINEEALGLWGVCFSWGEVDLSSKITENVRFFVDACITQSEITNPFGFEESLSSLENALRSGLAMANDVIYRLLNKTSLSAGAECVLLVQRGREIAIGQLGQPQILLHRQSSILPLMASLDFLPANLSSGAFVPRKLLGIHPSCYPQLFSFQAEKGDELILLAHSWIPRSLMNSNAGASGNLNELFQQIASETPESPFWMSSLKL